MQVLLWSHGYVGWVDTLADLVIISWLDREVLLAAGLTGVGWTDQWEGIIRRIVTIVPILLFYAEQWVLLLCKILIVILVTLFVLSAIDEILPVVLIASKKLCYVSFSDQLSVTLNWLLLLDFFTIDGPRSHLLLVLFEHLSNELLWIIDWLAVEVLRHWLSRHVVGDIVSNMLRAKRTLNGLPPASAWRRRQANFILIWCRLCLPAHWMLTGTATLVVEL